MAKVAKVKTSFTTDKLETRMVKVEIAKTSFTTDKLETRKAHFSGPQYKMPALLPRPGENSSHTSYRGGLINRSNMSRGVTEVAATRFAATRRLACPPSMSGNPPAVLAKHGASHVRHDVGLVQPDGQSLGRRPSPTIGGGDRLLARTALHFQDDLARFELAGEIVTLIRQWMWTSQSTTTTSELS
jgi:hypothetical protein